MMNVVNGIVGPGLSNLGTSAATWGHRCLEEFGVPSLEVETILLRPRAMIPKTKRIRPTQG